MKLHKLISLLLIFLLLGGCAAIDTVDIPQTPETDPPAAEEQIPQEEIPAEPETPAEPEVILTPEEQKATAILNGMTMEEKVGQLFLARCPADGAAQKAADYALGGYILFGQDFKDKTKDQAAADIASYQAAAGTPMLIAVDEEGGTVNRVSRYGQYRSIPFKSPQALYKEGGFDLVQTDAADKCRLLSQLGINVNMAPVADITTDSDAFMYKRSFAQDATTTGKYVYNVTTVMEAEGMGSVLKHFPGYGNALDSHTAITYDERPLEDFYASDFLPFKEGIKAGADAILVCHNIVKSMDADNPASLSPAVHQILREDLSFDGVIVTDDLYMDAIRTAMDIGEAAIRAVEAGNDLLCVTEFEIQVPAVIDAVRYGRIAEERIEESVMRILLWKIDLGLIA